MAHRYIAQNGKLYRTAVLVHVDQVDIETAIEYLTFHGRPPTMQAVADLLRSCASEGIFDLQLSAQNCKPSELEAGT